MTARAEKGALRDAHVVPNRDSLQIQQPAFLAQPDMVTNLQFPRKGDFHLWFDGHANPDPGAKYAQHRPLERRQAERAEAEKNEADEQPDKFTPFARTAIKASRGIG